VTEVHRGLAADSAGLRSGDVLLDFAGTPLSGPDDLVRLLTAERVGQAVPVRFLRHGEPRRAVIVATEAAEGLR
jgi:serine protease Do